MNSKDDGGPAFPCDRRGEGADAVNERVYVSIAQMGACKVCGQQQDLRAGACFRCMAQVSGERVSPTTHRLWETANPRNEWYYVEGGH